MFEMFENYNQENQNEYSVPAEKPVVVVSVGGSMIAQEKINAPLIAKLANSVNNLRKEGFEFILVAGGGKIARDYIATAKTLGVENNFVLDEIAITVTRLNALILIQAFDNAYPEVLTDVKQIHHILDSKKIPVFGGLIPGFTTDTVAASIAEYIGGIFVNLSNQDGVYNVDPAHSKRARLIPRMSHEKLMKLLPRADSRSPGENMILDAFTCMILNRSKITTFVLNMADLDNFENAVRGLEFTGTIIDSSEVANETDEI
ncbi:UMP kinase [Candidatus Micrarchaeota archaeon]|nr:UMP kinase [Candidatus Micrarchaeota archaeon]